jgi:hypothetical protein
MLKRLVVQTTIALTQMFWGFVLFFGGFLFLLLLNRLVSEFDLAPSRNHDILRDLPWSMEIAVGSMLIITYLACCMVWDWIFAKLTGVSPANEFLERYSNE